MSDSTANIERGQPNVIATRSIAKLPDSAWLRRTNRRPSAIDCRIGWRAAAARAASTGGWAESAIADASIARQLMASTR